MLIDQPTCCKKLVTGGWRFEYQPDTRFVEAIHHLGGKQLLVKVSMIGQSDCDVDEIGRSIAELLNGNNLEAVLRENISAAIQDCKAVGNR